MGQEQFRGFQQVRFGSESGVPGLLTSDSIVAPDGEKHLHGGSRSMAGCRLGLAAL